MKNEKGKNKRGGFAARQGNHRRFLGPRGTSPAFHFSFFVFHFSFCLLPGEPT
jgi:hypothetical protein